MKRILLCWCIFVDNMRNLIVVVGFFGHHNMGSKQLESSLAKRQRMCVDSGLNEDMLVEILTRLPCKSVIRFKCVSKQWYSLISESKFHSKFLNHHHQMKINMKPIEEEQPWAFVCLTPRNMKRHQMIRKLEFLAGSDCANSLSKSDLPFLHMELQQQQLPVSIAGSSDDLILWRVGSRISSNFYICNPFTKKYVALPPPPPCAREHAHFNLVCESFCNNVRLGFGFDSGYRYRVMSAAIPSEGSRFPDNQLKSLIFSSETGLWTEHVVPCPRTYFPLDKIKKLVAARFGQSMMCVVLFPMSLVIFDPFMASSSNTRVIPSRSVHLPHEFVRLTRRSKYYGTVFASQGRLVLVLCQTYIEIGHPTLQVWERELDVEVEWRLIHQVHMGEMKPAGTVSVDQDHFHLGVEEWRKDVLMIDEADVYDDVKHKRISGIANFFKSASESAAAHGLQEHQVACVGLHPFDANVMFLVLSLRLPPDVSSWLQRGRRPRGRYAACLVSYNMRTRAVELVMEGNMSGCRSTLLRSFVRSISGFDLYDVFPVVLQPCPAQN